MRYWIYLMKNDEPYVFKDYMLDGIIPQRTLELMVANTVEKEIGLCEKCDVHGVRCHVINGETGEKYCPILFHDVVKPPWKVSQVA